MEAVIIADDLTGANDSGVQLARQGLTTSVLLKMDEKAVHGQEGIVLNTDSRSISPAEAYQRVAEAARFMVQFSAKFIYKKIDSTLRGNIGSELDAMFDVFRPDFLIVAPAFPDNGRTTLNGIHYLGGRPVHETEVGADKKTPVTESYVPALLSSQTGRKVALIHYTELRAGKDVLVRRLHELNDEGIPYIVSDAENEADLYMLVEGVERSGYSVVWAGSAGLAKCLPVGAHRRNNKSRITQIVATSPERKQELTRRSPVLVAIGSITARSRKQLQVLLASPDLVGVKLQSDLLIMEPAEREREIRRVYQAGIDLLRNGLHVVVHVAMDDEEVVHTIKVGQSHGLEVVEISESIAEAIGEIVCQLLQAGDWAGVVMTGGDTATQICKRLGTERVELMGEVELGGPIGRLWGGVGLGGVTKTGRFGWG